MSPPFTSTYPLFMSSALTKSVARAGTVGDAETTYIPFAAGVPWFLTKIRSPATNGTPSIEFPAKVVARVIEPTVAATTGVLTLIPAPLYADASNLSSNASCTRSGMLVARSTILFAALTAVILLVVVVPSTTSSKSSAVIAVIAVNSEILRVAIFVIYTGTFIDKAGYWC